MVFLFKLSVDRGWLRPPIRAGLGLFTGIAILIGCELRLARNYRFTANALHGAGIATLYATLFAMHGRWNLVPTAVAWIGMLIVTAAAVFLSTRRDSIFIALLGLIGGFATPALLASDENRPLALFSYLLLLNGGISWIAYRKRWPLLTALSVGLTAYHQWSWVDEFLTGAELPLAAGIFFAFALVGASALWDRHADERQAIFRRIAGAAAVLPLLFAFFTAVVPEYGARYNVLFGFLLLSAAGLAAIAWWRGPEWLHQIGGVATLATFLIWLTASYTHASWPWSLLWLGLFVALYLVRMTWFAPLLFFVFIGFAVREPQRYATMTGGMLALLAIVLVVSLQRAKPWHAAVALAFSSIALMTLDPPLRILFITHAILFVAFLAVAWISERHVMAVLVIPFYVAMVIAADAPTAGSRLVFAAMPYALFIAYPLALGKRAKTAFAPYLAASLASLVFFVSACDALTDMGYKEQIGLLPVAQALVMVAVLWRALNIELVSSRIALVAATVLAFLTAAIPMQFENDWGAAAWALEAAALVWLYGRISHRGLLAWSVALAVVVLVWLLVETSLYDERHAYLISVAAMFAATRLAPPSWRFVFATAGTIELFFLLNQEIGRVKFQSGLAKDLAYTMGWAAFAIAMLVAGLVFRARAARIAALGLLLVTVLKCFLHDLARLGGLYRVGSLLGLAVSLVLVGLLLQKFVIKAGGAETSRAPSGTT